MNKMIRRTRLVLIIEGLWPLLVCWSCLVALYATWGLLDGPARSSFWVRLAVPGLTVLTALWAMWHFRSAMIWPSRAQILSRLQRGTHHPLDILADRPALGDLDLWQAHQDQARKWLVELRVGWFRSDMAARDPLGLRAACLLALVVGMTVAGPDAMPRLKRAFLPLREGLILTTQIWVTPPAYTQLPTRRLDVQARQEIPVGSRLLLLVDQDWFGLRAGAGSHRADLQSQSSGGMRAELDFAEGSSVWVEWWGVPLVRFPVSALADQPPLIGMEQPLSDGGGGRLTGRAILSDDYGVSRAWLRLNRPGLAPDDIPLSLPSTVRRGGAVAWTIDQMVGDHPLAGSELSLTVMVADDLGQEAATAAVSMVLPARLFTHPLARVLMDLRRRLTLSPAHARSMIALLDERVQTSADPGLDKVVFMALRLVRQSLRRDDFDLAEMQDLLWKAALRLEDGGLTDAARQLDAAQDALQHALAEGADRARIEGLTQALERAILLYLDSLLHHSGPMELRPEGTGRALTEQDLDDLLGQLRAMAQGGSRQALAELAGQLTRMIRGLKPTPSGQDPQLVALGRELEALGQDLRSEINQAAPPQQHQGETQRLREGLTDLTRRIEAHLGGARIPPLHQAADHLAQAHDLWGRSEWLPARAAQTKALAIIDKMLSDAQARSQAGILPRDPLGQMMPPDMQSGPAIPDQPALERARLIRDDIRRRADQWQRPDDERDYLRRLLRQF